MKIDFPQELKLAPFTNTSLVQSIKGVLWRATGFL